MQNPLFKFQSNDTGNWYVAIIIVYHNKEPPQKCNHRQHTASHISTLNTWQHREVISGGSCTLHMAAPKPCHFLSHNLRHSVISNSALAEYSHQSDEHKIIEFCGFFDICEK